jgi:hypothetical protein
VIVRISAGACAIPRPSMRSSSPPPFSVFISTTVIAADPIVTYLQTWSFWIAWFNPRFVRGGKLVGRQCIGDKFLEEAHQSKIPFRMFSTYHALERFPEVTCSLQYYSTSTSTLRYGRTSVVQCA